MALSFPKNLNNDPTTVIPAHLMDEAIQHEKYQNDQRKFGAKNLITEVETLLATRETIRGGFVGDEITYHYRDEYVQRFQRAALFIDMDEIEAFVNHVEKSKADFQSTIEEVIALGKENIETLASKSKRDRDTKQWRLENLDKAIDQYRENPTHLNTLLEQCDVSSSLWKAFRDSRDKIAFLDETVSLLTQTAHLRKNGKLSHQVNFNEVLENFDERTEHNEKIETTMAKLP